jgi:hypothetical protein
MPFVKEVREVGAETDRYVTARDILTIVLTQLDDEADLRSASGPDRPDEDVDAVIGMLCQQARAARQLASAAESLCAALAAERHYPSRR